ncbi:unnamed protein product, partial [Urochloa humidicola]
WRAAGGGDWAAAWEETAAIHAVGQREGHRRCCLRESTASRPPPPKSTTSRPPPLAPHSQPLLRATSKELLLGGADLQGAAAPPGWTGQKGCRARGSSMPELLPPPLLHAGA